MRLRVQFLERGWEEDENRFDRCVQSEARHLAAISRLMNNVQAKLLGIEMDLNIAEEDLVEIDKNLTYYNSLRADLIYNLKMLKNPNIVVVISSYNQSIVELKEVQAKLLDYRNMKRKVNIKVERLEKVANGCYEEVESIHSEIKINKKILLFKKKEVK